MINFKKTRQLNIFGFTLVEILVYLAILSLLFVSVVGGILAMSRTFNNYKLSKHINSSASLAMERMTREIRGASLIDVASVFGSHPGHLILDGVEFFASSTVLVIKRAGEDAMPLTSSDLELSGLIFREVATSTNLHSVAVKIELEIKGKSGNYEKVKKFYNTVVLRRGY
ncbi:type II secretion system GspH family protein [Patescibacteria group bacterium]|nr:type II secretion system GspH family protein [Patescibacteria group bacterium]